MNKNIFTIFFLITLISLTAFAAAPTVADLNIISTYTADKNYFSFPVEITAQATGADLNSATLCYYGVSSGDTNFPATWQSDTNRCHIIISSSSGNDDFNFSMKVQSSQLDANGISQISYQWRDTNAPTNTSAQVMGTPSQVTITCTDTATNTGNGSGCKTIYTSIDGGAYTGAAGSSRTVTVGTTGTHTVTYYAFDNLDNNGLTQARTGTITFYSGIVSSPSCSLILVITIILAALVLLGILGVMIISGGLDSTKIIALVVFAIGGVIAIIIFASITSAFCTI